MKRKAAYTLVLIFLSLLRLDAGERQQKDRGESRFTFGAEWSYVASFMSGWHYNFFSAEGYRIDERGSNTAFANNAEAYLHAGYDFDNRWNLSFYAGYAGTGKWHKTVPLSFRVTRQFGNSRDKDRWLAFVDLGSGICIKPKPQEIFSGKIGGGWRMSLSNCTRLDFLAAARITYTHPRIIYEGIAVPHGMTNRNEAFVVSMSVGLALTF